MHDSNLVRLMMIWCLGVKPRQLHVNLCPNSGNSMNPWKLGYGFYMLMMNTRILNVNPSINFIIGGNSCDIDTKMCARFTN